MANRDKGVLETLENWSSTIFLAAGILTLFAAVAYAANILTTSTLGGPLIALPRLFGIILGIVGFFGLYSLLANQTRQFALVGLMLVVGSLLANYLIILVFIPAVDPSPPFAINLGLVISGFWLLTGVGGAVLGIISQQVNGVSSGVEYGLYAWFVLGVVLAASGVVYGGNSPTWVSFIISSVGGGSLFAIGYFLRSSTGTDHAKSTDVPG